MANGQLLELVRPNLERALGRALPTAARGKPIRCASPLRKDKTPGSFCVWPDHGDEPGGWYDHATGEGGSLFGLAQRLDVAPPPPTDEDLWDWFCQIRRLHAGRIRDAFHIEGPDRKGNILFPTETLGPGTKRRRPLFPRGKQSKEKWDKALAEGERGSCLYGIDQAIVLRAFLSSPLYIVNGAVSVWAAWQSSVPAICFLTGERSVPPVELLERLVAYGRPIRIAYDRDHAGVEGANLLWSALKKLGADVEIVVLPASVGHKGDVDDLHRIVGDEGLAAALDGCESRSPTPEMLARARHTLVCGSDDRETIDRLLQAEPSNWRDDLFVWHGRVAQVQGKGLRSLSDDELAYLVNGRFRFVSTSAVGEEKTRNMPPRFFNQLALALADIGRVVERVIAHPIVVPRGLIVRQRTYLEAERALVLPGTGPGLCAEDSVSPTEARAVLGEVLTDFPFGDESSRTHVIALIATMLSPLMLSDCAIPLFVIESDQHGVGKSLLCRIVSLVVTGCEPITVPPTIDAEEIRKRIVAIAHGPAGLVLFDNIDGHLDAPALAAALTSGRLTDRVLGTSRTTTVLIPRPLVVTTAGGSLSAELERRAVRIRLQAHDARPERRSTFRHRNLAQFVIENRPRLLGAALCIAAQQADGAMEPTPQMGSFEAWVEYLAPRLSAAGFSGLLANRGVGRPSARSRDALHATLEEWFDMRGSQPATARELVAHFSPDAWAELGGRGDVTAQKLGNALGKREGRTIGRYRLRRELDRHRKAYLHALERLRGDEDEKETVESPQVPAESPSAAPDVASACGDSRGSAGTGDDDASDETRRARIERGRQVIAEVEGRESMRVRRDRAEGDE